MPGLCHPLKQYMGQKKVQSRSERLRVKLTKNIKSKLFDEISRTIMPKEVATAIKGFFDLIL